jgi:hypothetical protein
VPRGLSPPAPPLTRPPPFILAEVPTDRGDIKNNDAMPDCGVWIKAGVAAFTQLKF